jgi:hypothetical protein
VARPPKYHTDEERLAALHARRKRAREVQKAKRAAGAPLCECGCGKRTSGRKDKNGEPVRFLPRHRVPEYRTEAERKAAHREHQRRYDAKRRAGTSEKRARPFDPDPSGATCVECGTRLTVAAVAGRSDACSRVCAGFGETTLFGEVELTDAELAGVA